MALKLPPMRINKTWLMLGIAIVLAVLATVLTAQYLKNREATIETEVAERSKQGGPRIAVVVPVQDLPVGTPLGENVVAARNVAADLLYPGYITVDDFEKYKNQSLIRPVLKGRPLLKADLRPMYADFAGSLEPGTRAMTIDVDELNSVAHMVQPGNRIDLMLVMRRDDGGNTVVPFMDRMKVLATGQKVMPEGEQQAGPKRNFAYSNLTLEVTPPQAARLTLAQDIGKLRFTLRNEKDEASTDFAVNAQNIMEEVSVRARQARRATPSAGGGEGMVEFIVGGQRAGPSAKAVEVQGPAKAAPPAGASAPPGAIVPPLAGNTAAGAPNFDANGMTPEMKSELKKMLDK